VSTELSLFLVPNPISKGENKELSITEPLLHSDSDGLQFKFLGTNISLLKQNDTIHYRQQFGHNLLLGPREKYTCKRMH
jgi:hypothetical protein